MQVKIPLATESRTIYTTTSTTSKFSLQKSPLRKPLPDILSIPLNPTRLSPNSIQTLRQSLIKALCTLRLEKGLDLINSLLATERIRHKLDDSSKHTETRR